MLLVLVLHGRDPMQGRDTGRPRAARGALAQQQLCQPTWESNFSSEGRLWMSSSGAGGAGGSELVAAAMLLVGRLLSPHQPQCNCSRDRPSEERVRAAIGALAALYPITISKKDFSAAR